MFDNYLPAAECTRIILERNMRLWERKIEDLDFLDVRLGIGDIIYSVNSEGYVHPYMINQVLFSKKDVAYRNAIGTHICYEYELDNIHTDSDRYYFTSKVKRDEFIKSKNL